MNIRPSISLDGTWRFQLDPWAEGENLGYHLPGHLVDGWREVTVPCGFDACAPGLESYEGCGWYRRLFTMPEAWQGKQIRLQCAGVNYRATVWLNGQLVGEHPDGFLPFEFPIGHLLHADGENTLVIRADNTRRKGEVPGMERGWRPIGGILREVALVAYEDMRIARVDITAEPEDGNGRFSVQAQLTNDGDAPVQGEVQVTIRDAAGNAVANLSSPISLESRQGAVTTLFGTIPQAQSWHPASPVLYTAQVLLQVDGQVMDVVDTRFGFRRIEVCGTQLLLNGEPIILRGFNRHEDSPHTGMAVDLETARQDLVAMKGTGSNFVRLCHYPHHPGAIDLCDEMGLLVMGEIPLYWWSGTKEGEEHYQHKLAAARRQLRTMIERDANHPSIIFWSVSNETEEDDAGVVDGNDQLVQYARELDPTRIAVHVANETSWILRPHFANEEVICINAYPSCGHPLHEAEEDFANATRFWQEHLERLHEAYPDKPIFITEFGHPSIAGIRDGALGEDTQAQALAAEFQGMTAPYICGTLVWCYADHPWPEFGWANNLTTSPYGVVTRDRTPLPALKTVAGLFMNKKY
ncbi:MAG: glycoside hydrolase family 2 protein [Armatimonadota bacterium]